MTKDRHEKYIFPLDHLPYGVDIALFDSGELRADFYFENHVLLNPKN